MIPKIIHLCWFSGDPFPKDIQECIDTWKRVLPDFTIKTWTKEMALATGIDFVREAIEVRKWAFAADVIRLYAVYHDGGVYMDSDIYVIKRFDELLSKSNAFFQEFFFDSDPTGFVDEQGFSTHKSDHIPGCAIQAAMYMAEPGNRFIKELLDEYSNRHFILDDGSFNMSLLAPQWYALTAQKYGYRYKNEYQELSDDLNIYPSTYVGTSIRQAQKGCFAVHCIQHSWDDSYTKSSSETKVNSSSIVLKLKYIIYKLYCRITMRYYMIEQRNIKDCLKFKGLI